MDKFEFDISELFETFFGYKAKPFEDFGSKKIPGAGSRRHSDTYDLPNNEIKGKEELISDGGVKFYGKNSLGNMVFMPVTLIRADFTETVLENTVITMTCKKNIVETSLVAVAGTVKEEISINNWEITIKGVIVGKNAYPEKEVENLKELFRAEESLVIKNVLTAIFMNGEEIAVMKSLDIGDNKGSEIAQPFTMQLVSDTKFELYIEP